jgi:hypothetical protein
MQKVTTHTVNSFRRMFGRGLDILITLPFPNPDDEVSNMISVVGEIGNRYAPELFQIYQIWPTHDSNKTYMYCHLEKDTHKRLEYYEITNISTFEFPAFEPFYEIELYKGVDQIAI